MSGHPPPPDVVIDAELVGGLLAAQHPDLLRLGLTDRIEGWDNVTYRLGGDLAVRLPQRKISAPLILNEQRWLPFLAGHLEFPIPAPMRTGQPALGYPWHWSVVPWIPGRRWLDAPPRSSEAAHLGQFLGQLHAAPNVDEAPANPFRGGRLAERVDAGLERIDRLGASGLAHRLDFDGAKQLTTLAAQAPCDIAATWIHGDLHAKNIVVADGVINGVIDWGDLCAGDPATDLGALWGLFKPIHHRKFWKTYGTPSAATFLRARGWALSMGLMLFDTHHVDDPVFAQAGLRRAISALEEPPD